MTWFHLILPSLVSALLGGLITGLMTIIAVKVDIAALKSENVRNAERIGRVERKTGISDGAEPEFIRRQECFLMHEGTTALRAEFRSDFLALREELHELRQTLDIVKADVVQIMASKGLKPL